MTVSEQAETFERCMSVGGIAVFPADTVYGLACDAGNTGDVIRRLYALKRRPLNKPSAVMFFDLETALTALPELGERTRAALAQLLPGQVTVLVPNPERRFPLACGEDPTTLGLRVASVPALAGVRWPVLQSSANLAGGAEARTLHEVPELLRAEADLVIDGGELPGTPSTVVDLRATSTTEAGRSSAPARSPSVRSTRRCMPSSTSTPSPTTRRSRPRSRSMTSSRSSSSWPAATAPGGSWNSAPERGRPHGGCWPAIPTRRWSGSTSPTRCWRSPGRRLPADRVSLVVARLEDPLPDGPFDLVASALAVHHLAPAEKRRLFGRIREALSPGGRFVLADVIVPINPADVTIELTPGFDRPDTLSDLIVWLAETGFEVSVSWTHQDLAVLSGRIPA